MATVENVGLAQQVPFAGEYGNGSRWVKSFQQASVASGDILRIMRVPAGARVDEMTLKFDDCGAGMTVKLGYEPVVSADGPSTVDDYWGSAIDVATAAGKHDSIAHPIQFDYDVYVIVTVASASFTGSPKLTAIAKGEFVGLK